MAHPHRALLDLAAGRQVPAIEDPDAFLLSATEQGMAGLVSSQVVTGAIALPNEHTFQLAAVDVAVASAGWRCWRPRSTWRPSSRAAVCASRRSKASRSNNGGTTGWASGRVSTSTYCLRPTTYRASATP